MYDPNSSAWGGYGQEEQNANAPFLQEHQNAENQMGGAAFADGGPVPDSTGDQQEEGGVPGAGASQPAMAGPQQRLATAGSVVQSLLMHGMRKHNLIGPDGKPMRVGSYYNGGMIRSFADGGSTDAQPEQESPASGDEADGGSGPETQAAGAGAQGIPDTQMAAPGAGAAPGAAGYGNSVASSGSRQPPSLMQYVQGADAPPDQVMDQLHAAFKTGGRPGNEAALASVASAGEKSPDLGFSVVQGYRKRYDRHRAEAAKALDSGNLDGAVSSLNEAYNNFPTDENANFAHDGQNITASLNGKSYSMSPQMTSALLAKGTGGHFDNIAFTGLDQPFATLGGISAAAETTRMTNAMPQRGGAQGTQVAQQANTGARREGNNVTLTDAQMAQTPQAQKSRDEYYRDANKTPQEKAEEHFDKVILPHLKLAQSEDYGPAKAAYLKSQGFGPKEAPAAPAPAPAAAPSLYERVFGKSNAPQQGQPAVQTNPPAGMKPYTDGAVVPPGMEVVKRKRDGAMFMRPVAGGSTSVTARAATPAPATAPAATPAPATPAPAAAATRPHALAPDPNESGGAVQNAAAGGSQLPPIGQTPVGQLGEYFAQKGRNVVNAYGGAVRRMRENYGPSEPAIPASEADYRGQ